LDPYDVIIVGAGPAGLRCAEILGRSELSVLLLEKQSIVGRKICAGGITRKGFQLMQFPDSIIEHKVDEVGLHSPGFSNLKKLPGPVMFTVDRKVFGNWQLERLQGLNVTFRKNTAVSAVSKDSVITRDDQVFRFRYLVGSDGPNSLVRKHLELPVTKLLATVQYLIPRKNIPSRMDIYLHPKYFHSWYAWSFPHRDHVAVGACGDPQYLSGSVLKHNFHQWLQKMDYDVSGAKYESFPISYDYRGLAFDNIFLAGEAAGIASGLTGEGIYQSLVSGEEVAYRIMDSHYRSEDFRFVLKYNNLQHKFLNFSNRIGPLRYLLGDLLILAMRNGWVNRKISGGFS
jgi:geranylgeranyl reductase family protein